jgi:saccharopine dehydrogenase (NAD+, L-lysine forming)
MKIGILKETKSPADSRVPLTPDQCRLILDEFPGISICVQPSNERCFTNKEYEQEGIPLSEDLSKCDILMGVKEVKVQTLIPGKTYFFFSHTIKMQPYNRNLLATVLDKGIKLVDYEMLTDVNGVRIIGFGRWAGLAGTFLGIRACCIREKTGNLIPPHECDGLDDLIRQAKESRLPRLRIALTGDGRVSGGSEEMLGAFGVRKISVDEFLDHNEWEYPIYAQLDPAKYNKTKSGADFNLGHFFSHPEAYESNFNRFCNNTDLLIMAAYWDPRAPVLFTPSQMKGPDFSIRVIADITCDIGGSVPSSLRTTTFAQPYYDYNRYTESEEEAFSRPENVTVMSIDNLPCGLPKEASLDFGHNLIKNVLPLFLGGDHESIIKRATIAENGHLTRRYEYLKEWVSQKENSEL